MKKIKRLIAATIDFGFTVLIVFKIVEIILEKSGLVSTRIILSTLKIFMVISFLLYKDCLIGYESIGKKLMRLKIYQNNNRVMDKRVLLERNEATTAGFLLYPFMILIKNKSFGDLKYNTEVK